jgi:hypothetical protein
MNINEIKQAIDTGKRVYWSNTGYEVIKDSLNQYLIICSINDHCIGLHGMKGTRFENKLNGKESDFFIV